MRIAISGLTGIKDAVVAAGIRSLIEGMGFDVAFAVDGEARPVVATAPAAEIAAPKKRGRKPGSKSIPKPVKAARKTRVVRAASVAATSGGADPRGSIRDAVRAALTVSGRDLTTMTQEVLRTFPEKNRDYIGTVLCQLSKGGECELGSDGLWRKAAK